MTNVLSSANSPSTVELQQRCHSTSASAPSPSWPTMPRPSLKWAATARQEKIQLPIEEQNFSVSKRSELVWRQVNAQSVQSDRRTCRRVRACKYLVAGAAVCINCDPRSPVCLQL
jgi:hypothetical protein